MPARGRSTGGTPRVGKLIGGSRSGRSTNKNLKGGGTVPAHINMTNPAASGNADTVQQRAAAVTQGKMQQGQLKKNKSAGIRIGRKR